MAAPPNPFLPPDVDGSAGAPAALELADVPKRAAAAPTAPLPEMDTPPVIPPPRQPVGYKNPDSAGRTVLVLLLAAAGLGGAFLGIKLLRGKQDDKAHAKAAAEDSSKAKPVVWRALDKGDQVLIKVEVEPRGARLLLDGEALPSNPVLLPRGTEHRLAATADGHEPEVVAFTADAARAIKLTLKRGR
jgi:hypothetical protein